MLTMLSSSAVIGPLISSLLLSKAWANTATSQAQTTLDVLQKWYDEGTGLWDTCGWWNGANCMTVLADLAAVDPDVTDTATAVFSNTYRNAPAQNPAPGVEKVNTPQGMNTIYGPDWPNSKTPAHPAQGANSVDPSAWLDGYYDDDGWWALAWIAAYDITHNRNYLTLAEGIFDDMTQGWPTNCSNGGIWWNIDHTYVNAIPNELFLSVAGHLANRASNSAYYIQWAEKMWDWFSHSGMINAQGTINDGLTLDCQNNGYPVWTYNQGVVLGGLVELNRASPNKTYLDSAQSIALAAISALTDENDVLHDPCEPNCAPDATQFKGIFIRNLQMLQNVAPQDEYVKVIEACANSIWANDRNSHNQLSVDWSGPFINPANASTHSSALDALVAAISVEQ